MEIKNWKEEIEELISLTSENVSMHYEFVKIIGSIFEKNEFKVEQIISLYDTISNEKDHTVYMTISKEENTVNLLFLYDNTTPQRFSVNITDVNEVNINNFMGISIFKDVFNDVNLYFEKFLLSIINSSITTVKENGIY